MKYIIVLNDTIYTLTEAKTKRIRALITDGILTKNENHDKICEIIRKFGKPKMVAELMFRDD